MTTLGGDSYNINKATASKKVLLFSVFILPGKGRLLHEGREPEGDLREGYKDQHDDNQCKHKGKNTFENDMERHIPGHTAYHVYIDSHRRSDDTDLGDENDDDSEPNWIEA